jgi:PAS domain S-box-containing protein
LRAGLTANQGQRYFVRTLRVARGKRALVLRKAAACVSARAWVAIGACGLFLCTTLLIWANPALGQKRSALVFLSDKDYPPLSYLEGNKPAGMEVDFAKALGETMHREVRVELLDWREAQEKMLKGEGDALLSMSIAEDRKKLYDFTEPIVTHDFGIFVRGNDLTIRGLSDLYGKNVGVTPGGYPADLLEQHSSIPLVYIANYEDGFKRLEGGSIDAVVADTWVAEYVIQQHRFSNIRIAGKPIVTLLGALAVRKGEGKLADELNQGIRALKASGTMAQIQDRWRPQETVVLTRQTIQRYLETAGTVLLLTMLGAMGLWVGTLKKQIVARRKIEAELMESRERFLMASSAASMGTWRWTAATNESTRDANLNEIFGMGPHETKTTLEDFFEKIHEDDRAGVSAEFKRAIEQRGTYRAEFRIVQPDGTIRWVRAQGKPFYTERGDIAYVTGAGADITQAKVVEEELRKERDFTSAVVESSPAYFVALSPEHKVLMMNEAMLNAVGYRREQVIGADYLATFVPEKERAAVDKIFDLTMMEANPSLSTNHIQTAEGRQLLVEWSGKCIFKQADEPEYFFGVGIDITERARSEHEKAGLEAQLRHAQKMETVGRLAGGVAHDFNNLLTVINGYSDLLLDELRSQARPRKHTEEIRKAGERAANLTQQLLAVSRRQVTQPHPLRLNAVVTDAAKMMGRLLGEDVKLEVKLNAGEDQVLAEPGHLHQVLLNLSVNARDAMPRGGVLLIETSNVELNSREMIEDEEIAPGLYVRLSVRDSGTGMDEETLQHIFEPFYTTKERGKGSGLGLSIVYGIVRQSGGFIRVETVKGAGTSFHIFLPRNYAALPSVETVKRNTSKLHGSETVLVVEDQESVRELTLQILKTHGYQVLEASQGEEALRQLQDYPRKIHILLTDLVMPGINGKKLAEEARTHRPGLKVLFMSGYSDDVLGQRGVLEPGLAYIQKPFAPETLLHKIRKVAAEPGDAGAILVVDDEESIRNLFQDLLTQMGFRVRVATNGKEVLGIVDREEPALVITDLVMPIQEGIETIRILRERFPNLKIIAMSGAFSGQFLRTAKYLGADATLMKPIQPEALKQMVQELVGGLELAADAGR